MIPLSHAAGSVLDTRPLSLEQHFQQQLSDALASFYQALAVATPDIGAASTVMIERERVFRALDCTASLAPSEHARGLRRIVLCASTLFAARPSAAAAERPLWDKALVAVEEILEVYLDRQFRIAAPSVEVGEVV